MMSATFRNRTVGPTEPRSVMPHPEIYFSPTVIVRCPWSCTVCVTWPSGEIYFDFFSSHGTRTQTRKSHIYLFLSWEITHTNPRARPKSIIFLGLTRYQSCTVCPHAMTPFDRSVKNPSLRNWALIDWSKMHKKLGYYVPGSEYGVRETLPGG